MIILLFVVVYLQNGIWENKKTISILESKLNQVSFSNIEKKDVPRLDMTEGKLPLTQGDVVIYNRLPKTGSTTFSKLIYDLSKPNKIYVSHLNTTKNSFRWSLSDQYTFAHNVTLWNERKPAVYHGHISYIPFGQFGAPEPIYINIIREPLDRLVSYYYFLRYGDDFRKNLKRARAEDKTSFNSCVKKQGRDCDPKQLWVQIPFLCGHSAECWELNSEWALEQAKQNLLTKYALVGVTEQMEDFIVLLESTLPHMFHGITDRYRQGDASHVRKTLHKDPLSEETMAAIKKSTTYRMERELYDFALAHFNDMKQLGTYVDARGQLQPLGQKFRYEKVYGPRGKIHN